MNNRYIDETLDYKLVVQASVASKANGHLVYAIVNKETEKAVFETWKKSLTQKINTKKYKVVPIKEWLSSLSEK